MASAIFAPGDASPSPRVRVGLLCCKRRANDNDGENTFSPVNIANVLSDFVRGFEHVRLCDGLSANEILYVVSASKNNKDNITVDEIFDSFVTGLAVFDDLLTFRPLDTSQTVFFKLIVADETRCRTFAKQMERNIGLTNLDDKYLIAHCPYQLGLIDVYLKATGDSFDSILKEVQPHNQPQQKFNHNTSVPVIAHNDENNNTYSSSNNNNNNNSDNNDECVRNSSLNVTMLKADLFETRVETICHFYNPRMPSGISRRLLQLTGDSYRVELENFAALVSSYDDDDDDNDDRILLLPASGQLAATCQHILTFVLDTRHTLDDDEPGAQFAHMRSNYVCTLRAALTSGTRSVALGLYSLNVNGSGNDSDFQTCMMALVDALHAFERQKQGQAPHNRLDSIVVCCLDPELINHGDYFLRHGFDRTMFEAPTTNTNSDTRAQPSQASQDLLESLRITEDEDYDDEEEEEEEEEEEAEEEATSRKVASCAQCGSSANLLDHTTLIADAHSLFAKCKELSFAHINPLQQTYTCHPCVIVHRLAQISWLTINERTSFTRDQSNPASPVCQMCLSCATDTIVKFVKATYCSCCLRPYDSANKSKIAKSNAACRRHSACTKCEQISAAYSFCYICALRTFVAELGRVNRSPPTTTNDHTDTHLAHNHRTIRCAMDFCDLELQRELKRPVSQLACGHWTCRDGSGQATNITCVYCALVRLLSSVAKSSRMSIDFATSIDFAALPLQQQQQKRQQQNEQAPIVTSDDDDDDDNDEGDVIEIERRDDHKQQKQHVCIKTGGYLRMQILDESLPGFADAPNTLVVKFHVPAGVQQSYHPEPGRLYQGLSTEVFLPRNKAGEHAYAFLVYLFEHDALFKLVRAGAHISAERDYMVDFDERIALKTSKSGGAKQNGYPHEGYMDILKNGLREIWTTIAHNHSSK